MCSHQHKSIRKKTTAVDTLLPHITYLWPIFDFSRSYGEQFCVSSDSWGWHLTSSLYLTSSSFLPQSLLQGHKALSSVCDSELQVSVNTFGAVCNHGRHENKCSSLPFFRGTILGGILQAS